MSLRLLLPWVVRLLLRWLRLQQQLRRRRQRRWLWLLGLLLLLLLWVLLLRLLLLLHLRRLLHRGLLRPWRRWRRRWWWRRIGRWVLMRVRLRRWLRRLPGGRWGGGGCGWPVDAGQSHAVGERVANWPWSAAEATVCPDVKRRRCVLCSRPPGCICGIMVPMLATM